MAAAIPMVLTGLSTAVGMAGAQSEAAGAQAAAQYNAAIQTNQANTALQQAAEDQRRFRIQSKKQIGAQRAATAASGIQLDESALDVLEESASNAELDALSIKHEGDMKAWAYKAGANLDLLKGENAKTAGDFGSASYLLKGASSLASTMPAGKGKGG